MKRKLLRSIAASVVFCGLIYLGRAEPADSVVTAVFSRSFNKYQRPALLDGRAQPLTYVIAKGGKADGLSADDSMDNVRFASIVRVLGKYLAKQSYYPAKDAKKADLMLVVHWGKTIPGNDAQFREMLATGVQSFEAWHRMGNGIGRAPFGAVGANNGGGALGSAVSDQLVQGLFEIRFWQDSRDEANRYNANLLGYTGELNYRNVPSLYAGAGTAYHDLIEDLEQERYYVSVTAYDFQQVLQNKKNKGLWRTVASIEARGNRFDERLMAMIERASRYFGRDSDRLIRQFEYTPRIDFGELKQVGLVEDVPPTHK